MFTQLLCNTSLSRNVGVAEPGKPHTQRSYQRLRARAYIDRERRYDSDILLHMIVHPCTLREQQAAPCLATHRTVRSYLEVTSPVYRKGAGQLSSD